MVNKQQKQNLEITHQNYGDITHRYANEDIHFLL